MVVGHHTRLQHRVVDDLEAELLVPLGLLRAAHGGAARLEAREPHLDERVRELGAGEVAVHQRQIARLDHADRASRRHIARGAGRV